MVDKLKHKKQQQKIYTAEAILDSRYDLMPNFNNLLIKTKAIKSSNPNSKIIVDPSGVIVGVNNPDKWGVNPDTITIDDVLNYGGDYNKDEIFTDWNSILDRETHIWNYNMKNENAIPVNEVQKMINRQVKYGIYHKAFYKKYFTRRPNIIVKNTNQGSCWYNHNDCEITLKNWATDSVLLHEIAHQNAKQHGIRFATQYLLLVGRFMDHGQQAKLVHSYKKHGVEFKGAFRHTNKCLRLNGVTDPEILNMPYNNDKKCSQGPTMHFNMTLETLRTCI